MVASSGRLGRAVAIARQLCPRCREGPVFHRFMAMHDACAVCGHRFEREPGYFLGAMYVSYAIAVLVYLLLVGLAHLLLPRLPETLVLGAAFPPFLLFVPLIFRYSRVIWMHLDWLLDPGR